MNFRLVELDGTLRPGGPGVPSSGNLVVLSNVSRGGAECPPRPQFSLKYVAAGVEVYRYGGKTYPVAAGQFLAVPPGTAGDVEIAHSSESAASGLCVSLDCLRSDSGGIDAPVLFPAGCSILGQGLAGVHRQMMNDADSRAPAARAFVGEAGRHFEPLMEEALGHLSALAASRPSTRYDLLRKLNLARSYLHSVRDRPVELAELAAAAGVSQFHLLRKFRSCFGLPPTAYHRRIRLEAAKAAVDRDEMSCAEAAHRFGFADAASFSHSYRRAFGIAPTKHRTASGQAVAAT